MRLFSVTVLPHASLSLSLSLEREREREREVFILVVWTLAGQSPAVFTEIAQLSA
jgi:hypothetical protein